MKKFLLLIVLLTSSFVAMASISENELASLKGYTILGSYQITGWRDADGKMRDAYEGCQIGRVLILNYQYAVTCQGYWYEYAFHPTVVLLRNGSNMKMILNDSVRDIQ